MKTRKTPSFVIGALLLSVALLCTAALSALAQTAGFASAVVDYTPGTGISTTYQNSAPALGKPGGNVGGGTLSSGSELTGTGTGDQLTLALSNFVTVGPAGTREIGFFGNVALVDVNGNNPPTAGSPATVFGLRSVLVSVSADGVNFVPLNGGALITSTLPANYYRNADTSSRNAAPPANPDFADFGQPFTGTLADFDGKTYDQILRTTLNGSAGGTWLDLSGTGLAQVGYIRFANGGIFYLNGVSSNGALLGMAVPEPDVAVVWLAAGVAALAWGRRRRIGRAKYKNGNYGYGYNTLLVGQNAARFSHPGDVVMFATSAQVNTFQAPASNSHPMVEEFYMIDNTQTTVHFRAGGKRAMVVCLDGNLRDLPMDPSTLDARMPTANIGRFAPVGSKKYLAEDTP